MKMILLALMLFAFAPIQGKVSYLPTNEVTYSLVLDSNSYAQEDPEEVVVVEDVKPELEILAKILTTVKTFFPKAGPVLQLISEVVFGIVTIFTLLTAFLVALLKVPVIALRVSGASKLADKIQAFSDKVVPYFKYLSAFNSVKKK